MTASTPVACDKWFWQHDIVSSVTDTQLYAIHQRHSLGALKLKNALYLHLTLCTYHIAYVQT